MRAGTIRRPRLRCSSAAFSAVMCRRQVSARLCSPRVSAIWRKFRKHHVQKPAQPNALAFAPRPRRFMPSFQSPRPSAADRERPRPGCGPRRARNARTQFACVSETRGWKYATRSALRPGHRPPGKAHVHRARVISPVVSMNWLTAYGSQSKSSEIRVRTPRPEGGCHQCCTSPSTNWRDAREG